MKTTLRRRRPVASAGADVAPHQVTDPTTPTPAAKGKPDPDTQLQSRWTAGPALVTKAATGALWAGLLAGPVALLLTVSGTFASTPPGARLVAPVVDRAGEQAAAAEFAGRLVTVWLTSTRGQEARLTSLLQGVQVSLPELAWSAGQPTVANVRQLPDGTWMIVTAVPVSPSPGPAAPTSSSPADTSSGPVSAAWPVRYFEVPVHLDAGGPVALALPAPVAAPGEAAQPPRLDYRYRAVQDDPVGVSVSQFLAALLTGTGDVTRYLSPGTAISSVTPAPYTAVAVTDIATDRELTPGAAVPADGTHLRALVTATATAAPQQQTTVQYPLTLTVRGGRWEITALDPAPALQPTAPGAASRTGPASPGPAGLIGTPATSSNPAVNTPSATSPRTRAPSPVPTPSLSSPSPDPLD